MSFLVFGLSDDLIDVVHEPTMDNDKPFFDKHPLNKEYDVFMKHPLKIIIHGSESEDHVELIADFVERDQKDASAWVFKVQDLVGDFEVTKVKEVGEKGGAEVEDFVKTKGIENTEIWRVEYDDEVSEIELELDFV